MVSTFLADVFARPSRKMPSVHFPSMDELSPHEVFEFSQDETDFRPSKQFVKDLSESESPLLILFVGNGRAGKSTRANQLLLHELQPDSPFEADSGPSPITKQFQYVGPLKFGQLSEIHGITLDVRGDPDIFIIDCEGLHALESTTATLKQATFALSQMVTMTVLVMKDQVNHENVDHARSLFVLSHAFSRELPGFAIGTTIMMRDVGIRVDRGTKPSLTERNQMRQHSDTDQRVRILEVLNRAGILFSDQDLLVLAQPTFDDRDLYWKSIEDFLVFTANVASIRA
jgi:hypothetical protein